MEESSRMLTILSESSRSCVLSLAGLRARLRSEDGRDRTVFWRMRKKITAYKQSIESVELNGEKDIGILF